MSMYSSGGSSADETVQVTSGSDEEASVSPELRREMRSAIRLCLAGAGLVALALVVMFIGLGGPTFVDSPEWWAVIVVLAAVGSVTFAKGLRHNHSARRMAASAGVDTERLGRQMAPPKAKVILWTFLLIGWLTCCFIGAGPALAVMELGHTSTAVASDAQSWTPCGRCSQRAEATFEVHGQMVTTELRGVSQDTSNYHPGITVVYDVSQPTIAMAESDYRDGKGPIPIELIAGSTAVFFLGTWLLVAIPRRQRPPT